MDQQQQQPSPLSPSSSAAKVVDSEKVKVIEWEDFEQELARLWSLSSALQQAKDKKQSLQDKLNSIIQIKAESLDRANELEEMQEKLEARRVVIEKMSMRSKVAEEDAKKQEERLGMEVRSLLVAGTALSVARRRLQMLAIRSSEILLGIMEMRPTYMGGIEGLAMLLSQESNKLLSGEKGYGHLQNLNKKLRLRQQFMIQQVSLLYPVKILVGPKQEQELESFPSGSRSGNAAGSKPVNPGSLTILGLHLTMLPFTKMSLFSDKKEVQRSATALGYIAHVCSFSLLNRKLLSGILLSLSGVPIYSSNGDAYLDMFALLVVSLTASYLQVPLRYPLRLGGSRSYINDYAPSIEPSSSDLSLSTLSTNTKPVEFPLFLDGQDTTRAAYAVFLLNKDVEQLLNFIGVKSLGPRHVLANLKELLRTIQSAEYIDT
ncbi:hypothetical protein Pint_25485 [Pistacia integerrima]|uniref:Uncharacterized protein n=1 Tax=Pistacia integerrima TaxID=434235 RepID=A0ACC0YIF9_9ROSI|nr:hypothetical protein Pint_25485 [Pistacia integerrima]